MLNLLDSILLGLIQGITEFLPISSSGHLIIFRDFLGISTANGLAFDAVLQLATALAVVVYFRKDLIKMFLAIFSGRSEDGRESRNLLKWLIMATVPAVIIGLLLQDYIENVFRSTIVVAGTLIAGAVIMTLADKFIKKRVENGTQSAELSFCKSILVGLFQSLALIPGMSRSGMTISGGYFMGLSKEFAIKFSFLLSIPIIVGSGVLKLGELVMNAELIGQIGPELLAGSITAFVFGLLSIDFLLKFLKNNSFKGFVIYRVVLAVVLIVLSL